MEALIVYPENKEQLMAIKAVMKAMKIAFEQKKDIYPSHVVEGVKKSLAQAESGELIAYEGLDSLLK